jgi:nucleotide-binding universal stress UspA family protein
MSFINRILVPVDLSPCSAAALRYAAFVGAHSGAHIHVLHVMEQAHDADRSADEIFSPRRQARHAKLEALVGEALAGGYSDAEVSVAVGDAATAIVEAAAAQQADLVVMGKYGDRAFDASLPGNVLEAVSSQVSCSVVPVFESILDGSGFALCAPKSHDMRATAAFNRAEAQQEKRKQADSVSVQDQAGRAARRGAAKGPRVSHH